MSTESKKPAKKVVVLRAGWSHDPYRRAGGIVIHSKTPTEVDADVADLLVAKWPDAFTIKK